MVRGQVGDLGLTGIKRAGQGSWGLSTRPIGTRMRMKNGIDRIVFVLHGWRILLVPASPGRVDLATTDRLACC